jgi:hypothetical protein
MSDLIGCEGFEGGGGRLVFKIYDSYKGPQLKILFSNHSGNRTTQEILATKETFAKLGELFAKAAEHDYGKAWEKHHQFEPERSIACGDIDEFGDVTGSCNLEYWYNDYQFVPDETTSTSAGETYDSKFLVNYTPLVEGAMTGTIYHLDKPIQTFCESKGTFTFNDLEPDLLISAIGGSIDHNTGELKIFWNCKPGKNHCVVSYEYRWKV